MQDLVSMVSALRRPPLLVRAARHGISDYSRTRHLPRLLRTEAAPPSGPAITQLLDLEAALNERRRTGAADYAIARHVEVLIALLGEVRLLRETRAAARPPRVVPAPDPAPNPLAARAREL